MHYSAFSWCVICELFKKMHGEDNIKSRQVYFTSCTVFLWEVSKENLHKIFALLGCYTELIVTDFSIQPIGPIFKGQAFQEKSSTVWPLKMGPIGCLETSVTNYQSTLRNVPEERSSRVHLGGSLKSLRIFIVYTKKCHQFDETRKN
jgi:hypothetical protein